MKCKDCYHNDVCLIRINNIDFLPVIKGKVSILPIMYKECDDVEKHCLHFKDKSRFVELPNIEIGQELFYIDQYEKRVKSDTVSKLTFEKSDLGIDTGVWSEDYGFSKFFSDVGKTLFLSKEEAETRLKDLSEK